MPVTFLDPNADIKAQWTEDPAGTSFSKLDDAVRSPTAPTTGSDRITSATDSQIDSHDYPTFTIPANEAITQVRFLVYISTPSGRSVVVNLVKTDGGTSNIASTTVPSSTAASWQNATFTGSMTQTRLDGLQTSCVTNTGSGTAEIDACYLEVTTKFVITANTATETDAAQTFTVSKRLAVGTASTSNTAFALARSKALVVGRADSTSSAFAITPSRSAVAGTASETDVAQPVTPQRAYTVGTATEADEAATVVQPKFVAVGLVDETDSTFGVLRVHPVGTATETDQAFAADGGLGHVGFGNIDMPTRLLLDDPTATVELEQRTASLATLEKSLRLSLSDHPTRNVIEARTKTLTLEDRTVGLELDG